jgi:hypothetical protein
MCDVGGLRERYDMKLVSERTGMVFTCEVTAPAVPLESLQTPQTALRSLICKTDSAITLDSHPGWAYGVYMGAAPSEWGIGGKCRIGKIHRRNDPPRPKRKD